MRGRLCGRHQGHQLLREERVSAKLFLDLHTVSAPSGEERTLNVAAHVEPSNALDGAAAVLTVARTRGEVWPCHCRDLGPISLRPRKTSNHPTRTSVCPDFSERLLSGGTGIMAPSGYQRVPTQPSTTMRRIAARNNPVPLAVLLVLGGAAVGTSLYW